MRSVRSSVLLLAMAGWAAVSALPSRQSLARIVSRQEVQEEYDYVIVGGGTSGLTVGDRLTENGKCAFVCHEAAVFLD